MPGAGMSLQRPQRLQWLLRVADGVAVRRLRTVGARDAVSVPDQAVLARVAAGAGSSIIPGCRYHCLFEHDITDMIFRSVAVYLPLWLGLCSAVQAADRFPAPSQSIQGTVYPSACAPKEQRALRQALASGHPRAAQAAWTLVETVLCAPADAATLAALDAHVPRAIERIDTDLDAEATRIVRKDHDFLRAIASAGEAWDASLDASKEGMTLQYYWNEACIRRLEFQYAKGTWMLRQLRNACD